MSAPIPTRSTVRKSMAVKRKKFLKEATTAKEIRFGNDPDAFNFACWDYYYMCALNRGNYESLREITYGDYYSLFTNNWDSRYHLDMLKEEYSMDKSKDTKVLIDLTRILRKRYGER